MKLNNIAKAVCIALALSAPIAFAENNNADNQQNGANANAARQSQGNQMQNNQAAQNNANRSGSLAATAENNTTQDANSTGPSEQEMGQGQTTGQTTQSGTSNSTTQPNGQTTQPGTSNSTTQPYGQTTQPGTSNSTTQPNGQTTQPGTSNSTTQPMQNTPTTTPTPNATQQHSQAPTTQPQQPVVGQEKVLNFASQAAVATFSYDYKSYQDDMKKMEPFFTESGWQSFDKAIKESKNLDVIQKEKLNVSAKLNGQAKLVKREQFSTGEQWLVEVPIQVTYQNDKNQQINQELLVNMTLVHNSKTESGLGIMQFIAKPAPKQEQTPA